MDHIRLVVKLLEQLGVQHPDKKIEAAVVVRYYCKDGSFPFAQAPQFHFVCLGDAG